VISFKQSQYCVELKHCISVAVNVLCRYVHSECDEGVEQNKLKPEDYVCLACKNRDTMPVSRLLRLLAFAIGCV